MYHLDRKLKVNTHPPTERYSKDQNSYCSNANRIRFVYVRHNIEIISISERKEKNSTGDHR